MFRTIPRWVYAGAAAGLLALAAIALAPDSVLAGVPYRRITPPTVTTLVLGADAGFDTINAFTVKADSFQTHTPNGPLDIATAGTGDVEIGNSTSGTMILTGGNATFSGNTTAVVCSATLVSASSITATTLLASGVQLSTRLNLASGATRTLLGRCDERGNSTFPQTCDELGGLTTIAGGAGATPFVINNALVQSDTAICSAHLTALHAGCTTIYCVAAAGTLTFQTNANCLVTSQDFTWTLEHAGEPP